MDELIKAFATLGITIPEGTAFADLQKVMKANKKVLQAHDQLAAVTAEGPESDPETPADPEPTTDPAKTADPKPADPAKTTDPEPTADPETPAEPAKPATPPKTEVAKPAPTAEPKQKNKFVTQR